MPPSSLFSVLLLVSVLANEPASAAAQADSDAENRALVQRLTLDHASAMVAVQKKADEREQELFAQLDARDRQLRTRERALRQEAQKQAGVEAELETVLSELNDVTRQRQEALDRVAAQNRQFAIEITEYRRQVASIAGSPDPRKRSALTAYADGDRKNAFAVLVDIQRAEEKAVAAGWLELGMLAIDMNDRGELQTAEVIDIYERAQRGNPDQQWGWIELTRLYMEVGRLEDASHAASEALRRAADDRSRAVAATSVGVVLWMKGDFAAARGRFEEAAVELRRLAAAAPSNRDAAHDLGAILQRLGGLASDMGDLRTARTYVSEELAVARRLAAARPADLEAQSDVGLALDRLGALLLESGDLAAARSHFEESLAIVRRAATVDSSLAASFPAAEGALAGVTDNGDTRARGVPVISMKQQ